MDNETFHACQLAIRERIKAIDSLRNSPQSDRAGLIQMGFALRLLARRYIKAAEWPGHEVTDDVRLGWEFEWYMNYIKAIVQICKTAQIAVREKRLTLRNQLTRTPLFIADLEAWLNMDIDAALKAEANEFFPGVLNLHPAFDAWPDVLCIPPGSAYVQDIATWAAGDGLASVDDALSLLTGAAPAQTAAPPAPMEAVGASGDVEPKSNLPWWQVAYDIHEMAQNIGAKFHGEQKRASNAAIAREIEKRINDIERSKGRSRKAPNHDTIRGLLTGWVWRPE